jgi:alpha-galactosidase
MAKRTVSIAFIGAGSNFCPKTVNDLFLNEPLNELAIDLRLMDISQERLDLSEKCTRGYAELHGRKPVITATTSLEAALNGADFVFTAIEQNRYHYWTMDFHIPRRYGFNQVYGENGGPGGMFHFLRNVGPTLEIAYAMERLCPDALLINYANPEAKLIEAVTKLTKTKAVGLCHGIWEGVWLIAELLEMSGDDIEVSACGLNHFGWFQKIRSKDTGEDLYPLLRERERSADWLHLWDAFALQRIMLRTYGLLPYPVTNHIGEYFRWADGFIASPNMQYFYDPVREDPWAPGAKNLNLVYWVKDYEKRPFFTAPKDEAAFMAERFAVNQDRKASVEGGVPIITAITRDEPLEIVSANLPNYGHIPGLPDGMAVELPATADGRGLHARHMDPLPIAITEMLRIQGAIHALLIEAFNEKSRNKLLQAVLLDPTVSSYHNAVALIDEMFVRQKDALPDMKW